MHAYLVFILLYFRGEKLFVVGILCCSDWTESFRPTNLLNSTINPRWGHFNDVKQVCILRRNQQCALIDDRSCFKRQRHLCVKEKSPWEMSYFQVTAISQALPRLTRHWRLNIVALCSMFSYWQRNRIGIVFNEASDVTSPCCPSSTVVRAPASCMQLLVSMQNSPWHPSPVKRLGWHDCRPQKCP